MDSAATLPVGFGMPRVAEIGLQRGTSFRLVQLNPAASCEFQERLSRAIA